MSYIPDPAAGRLAVLGSRATQSAAALVQNDATDLFTVAGGDVLVTCVYGKVSTVIGANAITVKLQYTKTGGSAVDLTGATTVTSDAVGTFWVPTFEPGDTMGAYAVDGSDVPNVTFGIMGVLGRGWILPAGAMTLLSSNADPDGGAADWNIFYVPLATGAAITAT